MAAGVADEDCHFCSWNATGLHAGCLSRGSLVIGWNKQILVHGLIGGRRYPTLLSPLPGWV